MNVKNILRVKIIPSCENRERIAKPFIGLDFGERDIPLQNFSKGIKQIFENSDETATIEEVYELFSNINEGNADLARIVSVLRGEDGAAETNLGIKQFGERFGRKFGLYQDKSNKLFLGVFAGLGNRLVRYSLRFLFLAVPFIMVEAEGTAAAAFTETLWGSVFWAYFLLYWVMVTAPPEAETKIVDWNIFPFAIQGEVSSLVISAIDRDPNFDLRLQSLKQMVGKVYAQRLIEHQARFAESTVSSYGELEEEEVYGELEEEVPRPPPERGFLSNAPNIFESLTKDRGTNFWEVKCSTCGWGEIMDRESYRAYRRKAKGCYSCGDWVHINIRPISQKHY